MDVFTSSISKWRQLKARNIELIDTTIGSGSLTFAPTWDLVMGHKRGLIGDEEYTEGYLELMRQSYLMEPGEWNRLLYTQHPIALGCYCSSFPGTFCHRHLLKDILFKICKVRDIPYQYYGEFE